MGNAYETPDVPIAGNPSAGNGNSSVDPRLGNRIREARKEQQLTIKELSAKVGCSTTHLTRIELGQRPLTSFPLLMSFADVLHIPSEELIALAGQGLTGDESYLKLALPSVKSAAQEDAVVKFAQLITANELTDAELEHILTDATAFVEYCVNHRPSQEEG